MGMKVVGSRQCVWAGGKLLCVPNLILHSTVGKGPERVAGSGGPLFWDCAAAWERVMEVGRRES